LKRLRDRYVGNEGVGGGWRMVEGLEMMRETAVYSRVSV
jgi:hypothetical protein